MMFIINFGEAEAIGQAMHDRFVEFGVTLPLSRDDMGWADLVQFVVRKANAALAARAQSADRADDTAGAGE